MQPIDQIILEPLVDVYGPVWIGLTLIMFFVFWVAVFRMRLETALVGMVPALILASAFIPGLNVVLALAGGLFLGLVLLRIGVR